MKQISKKISLSLLAVAMLTGCSQNSNMVLEPGKTFKSKSFRIDNVKDSSQKETQLDTVKLLKDAVVEELKLRKIYSNTYSVNTIDLDLKILNFSEGNAFKRWLMPGWGATRLNVETKFKSNGKVIATSTVEHSVAAGGGYTIGADKYIYKGVAKNIVDDIQSKM